MSLRDEIEKDRTGPGPTCPIRVLIQGGIPTGSTTASPLEADDREYLAEVVAEGVTFPYATVIRRKLTERGFFVGATAVGAHRGRRCGCFAREVVA